MEAIFTPSTYESYVHASKTSLTCNNIEVLQSRGSQLYPLEEAKQPNKYHFPLCFYIPQSAEHLLYLALR